MPDRLKHLMRFLSDPGRLVAMALGCILVALFAGYMALHETADRVLALRQGPPPPVAIEAFRPMSHMGPAREVTVQGVADPEGALSMQIAGDDGFRSVIVLPLLSTAPATEGGNIVPGFAIVDATARGARPDIAGLVTAVPGDGTAAGPLYEVTGQSVPDDAAAEAVAARLAEAGLTLAEAPLIVRPYLGSREAALRLANAPHTWWHGLLWAAGLLIGAAIWQAGKGELPRPDHVRLYESERRAWRARQRPGVVSSRQFAPISSQDEVDEGEVAARPSFWQGLLARFGRPVPASELHADAGQP
jgi:hypothetical protein